MVQIEKHQTTQQGPKRLEEKGDPIE